MFQKIKNYLYKPETLIVLLSLGITTLISTVFALGFYLYTGKFLAPFCIITALQFFFFVIANTILKKRDVDRMTRYEIDALEKLSKFSVNLQCSYCKLSNTVPITLNKENRFTCNSCKQVNGIKMQFFTTQITTPIETNPIERIIETATKTSVSQNP